MKRLLLLSVLFITYINNAQEYKYYTVYDSITHYVKFVQKYEVGTQPTHSTEKMVTENCGKPKYIPESDTFINDATTEEQNEWQLSTTNSIIYSNMETENSIYTSLRTSEQLNTDYPNAPPKFKIWCWNIGTGVLYIKDTSGSWKSAVLGDLE